MQSVVLTVQRPDVTDNHRGSPMISKTNRVELAALLVNAVVKPTSQVINVPQEEQPATDVTGKAVLDHNAYPKQLEKPQVKIQS